MFVFCLRPIRIVIGDHFVYPLAGQLLFVDSRLALFIFYVLHGVAEVHVYRIRSNLLFVVGEAFFVLRFWSRVA